MEYKELLLKAAFCTMACDGNIADSEVQYVKDVADKYKIGNLLDVETTINKYVQDINQQKLQYLNNFIKELSEQKLTQEQEIELVKIVVEMILADEVIEYSEIKFFKKIRRKLSVSDEQIKEVLPEDSDDPDMPTKDDFLAPDIEEPENDTWSNISFEEIKFDIINLK